MAYLGKEIRLNRLLDPASGKLLSITVDHSMARGIMHGLIDIGSTIGKIVAGQPSAITMHKGIAEACFAPYAGKIALIVKCSTFSPYQPAFDTWVTDAEECVRLGADAISMGCIVGGSQQPEQLRQLGLMAKQAGQFGMPLVAHIYPRGELVPKDARYQWENIAYAVRAGAELGVDIIKTSYTGDPDSMAKVVAACPTRVVIAGGDIGDSLESYFQMARDAMDIGCAGVTFGRFVWEYVNISALIRVLRSIIFENASVKEANELLKDLESEQVK